VTTPRSTIQYSYDAKNRLTTMTDSLFGAFRFAYDTMDRRTSCGIRMASPPPYDRDEYSRVTAVVTKDQAGTMQDAWSYAYDAVSVRTSKTNMTGAAEIYQFDRAYRLTQVDYADGKLEKFTYDPTDNRAQRIDENDTTTVYSYDIANQLVSAGADTFTYDGNGSLTKTSPANATITRSRRPHHGITMPQGSETSLYSPDGTRIEVNGASVENRRLRVLNDAAAHPILDWGTDNQVWTYRLFGPQLDEVLAEYRRVNNRITYMHRDDLKSITLVTDTAGKPLYRTSYSAFGTMTRSADPSGIPQTRLGYTGREISVGSLMQYRSRYYDTSLGRFTSQDSYGGEATNPASQNRYTYVHNNPVQFNDPTGMFCANPSPMRYDWELNRWHPASPFPHPIAPGICNYWGIYAQNLYVNFKGHFLHINPLGKGWLHAPYLSYKEIP
jgi:RHS repeat-associated protein